MAVAGSISTTTSGGGVWSTSTQRQQQQHEAVRLDLQIQSVAATLTVPTLPAQVRAKLRDLGLPVRLFGENLANVRDRLRLELARHQVMLSSLGTTTTTIQQQAALQKFLQEESEEEGDATEEQVTKYTQAPPALIEARQVWTQFSLQRAQTRLTRERLWRNVATARQRKRKIIAPSSSSSDSNNDEPTVVAVQQQLDQMEEHCRTTHQTIRQWTLEGSQYGDTRSLSCIAAAATNCNYSSGNNTQLVVTGSWTGTLQLWNGGSRVLERLGERTLCHEDRIMGLAVMNCNNNNENEPTSSSSSSSVLVCTASNDMTAKLWKVDRCNDRAADDDNDDHGAMIEDGAKRNQSPQQPQWSITEQGCLKGHAARLCRTAFHPMQRHVATTSFDHTWRLWDLERATNSGSNDDDALLLLQDGHAAEVYGVNFHPDGSLVATTDFAGVVQLWDLRTGRSIRHWAGQHARRVLHAAFHPAMGFQMATAGDDGTIRIWDLRKSSSSTMSTSRQCVAAIPAHTNTVTGLRWDPSNVNGGGGEYLVSCALDGTVKVWNTRRWTQLTTLHGHEGPVSGIDILVSNKNKRPSLVSCGFDKTLKLWR